jgi:hypothetical protein
MQDYDLFNEFQSNYQYARDYWSSYVSNTEVFSLAASGYIWSNDELKQLAKEGREPINFNIMRRVLEFYSGYLRDNLNSVVYEPVEGSDQQTADQFTKLSYYVWDKGKGWTTFLDACDEMFKSGMSLVGLQMDYTKDFIHGDLSFYKRTYNSFFLDPTFDSIDLKNCGFAITRDLLGREETKALLPFADPKVIDDLPNSYRDNKFESYQPNFTNMNQSRKIVTYDQYYRRTSRKRKYLVDDNSGHYRDITDLEKDEREKLEAGLYRLEKMRSEVGDERGIVPRVSIQDHERPFIELNVMLNGVGVYSGEDHTGITESYPFVPLLCYFEPSIWLASQRIQGIASSEYSNSRQFNKRHMKIQDMFDSVISTGYKYLLGSVPDIEDLQQTGQQKLIGVDPDNAPEGLNSVQELNGANVPPSLLEYANILDQLSLTLANVNESLFGIDEGGNTQVSGRLAEMRVAQGLRSNRKVFDNIEHSQQILGGLVLKVLQNKYPPEKIERILAEEPTEQFYEKNFELYDAVIREGVRSKSQKDAYYYELVNLKREGIVDVPQSEIIRALSMTGVDDLQKAIEAQEQQQAEQQAKVDALERMQLELGNAKVEESLSLASERRARVQSDLALSTERISEAEENRAQAALARAKTLVEISNMQSDQLMSVIEFVNNLQRQEILDRELIGEKVSAQAKEIENTDLSDNLANTMNQEPTAPPMSFENEPYQQV